MGKPSSSSSISKKKRSKYSSQARTKKKSRTRTSKLKKRRRHDDSVSDSDDDSRNSVSVSSSCSEDGHRGRRSRSHVRKDIKDRKKKARARSSSSEDSHRARKKKRSKRDHESRERKKRIRETKAKRKKMTSRDTSISSRSSGSRTCSSCQSPNTTSDESKYKRSRGRSERRVNSERKMENVKSGAHRTKYRSLSCSSCSRHSADTDYLSEEKVTYEDTSRRLRSVITTSIEDKGGRELVEDEHKEEMIYDHDDYPSCRSNDSNDGGDKRESAHLLRAAFGKRMSIEDEKKEDVSVSCSKTTKFTGSVNDRERDSIRDKNGCDGNGTNDGTRDKKNKVSEAVRDANIDDLESLLREKALENLRRFRGGPLGFRTTAKSSTSEKNGSGRTIKQQATGRTELCQNISPNYDDDVRVVSGDSTQASLNNQKIPHLKNGGNESVPSKNIDSAIDVVVDGGGNVNLTVGSDIKNPRLVTLALRQALSDTCTNSKKVTTSSESNQTASVSGTRAGESYGRTAHVTPVAPIGNVDDSDTVSKAFGSTSVEPSALFASAGGDNTSDKLQDEVKDGSQLEQRTMSVMRGGEMVQVSYKVYIPKKAPALARRQLKR